MAIPPTLDIAGLNTLFQEVAATEFGRVVIKTVWTKYRASQDAEKSYKKNCDDTYMVTSSYVFNYKISAKP